MPSEKAGLPSYIQVPSGEWIVVAERKRAERLRRPDSERVLVVKVDGGFITKGERADYVVAHPKIVDVIIELKGSDVSKAISQIRATRPIRIRCEWSGERHAALIVRGKGVHPKLLANFERWQREFRKTWKMKLLVETRNRDYAFSEFLMVDPND